MSICGVFPPFVERQKDGKVSLLVDGCYINNVPGKVEPIDGNIHDQKLSVELIFCFIDVFS